MDPKDTFTGKWIDSTGKVLVVANDGDKIQVDFYKSLALDPASRKMATGECSLSLKMASYMDGPVLVVELGTEGVGATLRLRYSLINGKECLIPQIEHGLYGDNEEDFGVPWLFPMSIYVKSR